MYTLISSAWFETQLQYVPAPNITHVGHILQESEESPYQKP